jgi:glyoxylase-like metal-dependent hydrolase (beta-lactamase superfamily II)
LAVSDWALDLGGVTVRGVADEDPLTLPRGFFPGAERELLARAAALDPAACDLDADAVLLRVQVFAVEAFGRTVLVDAGIGDGKERPARPSWHRRRTDFLARLGVAPDAVEAVIFTHLHVDHVGWATQGHAPVFRRARHIVAEAEYAHWLARHEAGEQVGHGSFADSVLPLHDAGLLDRVPPDHAPLPGLRLRPLPGHTPGQVGVLLEGTRLTALITADAIHHPMQVLRPSLVSSVCADPAGAAATREALLEEAADGLTLMPCHARGAALWHVRREGGGYTLD